MFVLGNIIFAIARVMDTLLTLYFWVVIISALLTWVRPDPYNPVVRTLNALTEPVLYRIRKWLPFTYISGLDLSPIVVLIAIQLVQSIVVRSLFQYAAMLQPVKIERRGGRQQRKKAPFWESAMNWHSLSSFFGLCI